VAFFIPGPCRWAGRLRALRVVPKGEIRSCAQAACRM